MNRDRALVLVLTLTIAGAIALLARILLADEGESILPAATSMPESDEDGRPAAPRRAFAVSSSDSPGPDELLAARDSEPALGEGTVLGRALGASGCARTGLEVALYREGPSGALIGAATTNDGGAFRSEGVPVGLHLLELRGIVEGFHYALRHWVELEEEVPVDIGKRIGEPAAGRRIRFIIENDGRP